MNRTLLIGIVLVVIGFIAAAYTVSVAQTAFGFQYGTTTSKPFESLALPIGGIGVVLLLIGVTQKK